MELQISARRRRRVTLTPKVYAEAEAATRGVLPETLVNLWLTERLQSGAN